MLSDSPVLSIRSLCWTVDPCGAPKTATAGGPGNGLRRELLDKVAGKKKRQCSETSKTSVAASTRTRSSSLAAIPADSARSNAQVNLPRDVIDDPPPRRNAWQFV